MADSYIWSQACHSSIEKYFFLVHVTEAFAHRHATAGHGQSTIAGALAASIGQLMRIW